MCGRYIEYTHSIVFMYVLVNQIFLKLLKSKNFNFYAFNELNYFENFNQCDPLFIGKDKHDGVSYKLQTKNESVCSYVFRKCSKWYFQDHYSCQRLFTI